MKSSDSFDENLRYVEGRSQCGLNDVLPEKSTHNHLSPSSQNSKSFSRRSLSDILFDF